MMIYGKKPSKMKFFECQGLFFVNSYYKNKCKNDFRTISKNHAGQS